MKNPKEEHKSLMEKLKPLQEQWQRDMLKTLQEPKQVTLEEVAEEYAISKSSSSVFQKAHIRDFIAGAKWQQERMYSENDLKEAFKQSRRTNIFEIGMPLVFDSFEDWFKQYKK